MTSCASSPPDGPTVPGLLLALNNCEERLQLVLGSNGPDDTPLLLSSRELNVPRRTVQFLLPAVAEMLAEQEREAREIGRIAVVRGPGSFTGIRLALAAAAGIACGLPSAPLLAGIDYLPLVAAAALVGTTQPVTAVTYARRGQVYMQCFAPDGHPLAPLAPISAQEAAEHISRSREPQLVIGTGIEKNPEAFAPLAQAGHVLLGPEHAHPCAAQLLRTAHEAEFDTQPVQPAYGRMADAEANLDTIAAGRGLEPAQARGMLARSRGKMSLNPVLLEVFKNRFSSIAEEMGVTLTQTAFSPNIKERRDLSCAVFDARGDMIAQAAHIPVHLGSMPMSVKAAIEAVRFEPGDMVMLNDPFQGGTHLPDITIVAPVFPQGETTPAFFVANRAHHADVGGMSPGSMPLSTSLFQEGVIIPPVRIMRRGRLRQELMRFLLANVRTPKEREGDFAAQFMANNIGVRRMGELLEKYGLDQVRLYAAGLMDYAETLMRATLADIPDGHYQFEDRLDDDGRDTRDIPIRLEMTIAGQTARLDFTGSADQVEGSVNAVRAITVSAVLYAMRAASDGAVPTNAGLMRPVEVKTRHGSVLDARFPAAVAGGNVETSQRVVDVVLGALAKALPSRIPSASQGTMNNLTIGGLDTRQRGPGRAFAYYETLAGGMGGGPGGPGESAVHSHMTNTLNTPIEALEYAYPFRVLRFGVRRGSGGAGRHPGGDGLTREMEMLDRAEVTVLSERRESRPYGLSGGDAGKTGKNTIVADGRERVMPAKFRATLEPGHRLRMDTPGGGGWGQPADSTDQ